jgi:CHAT domain-containing protein
VPVNEPTRSLAALRDDAEGVLRLAFADPSQATAPAEAVLARGRVLGDVAAISTALQAMGLAARQQGDISGAVRHLQRSVRTAERGGVPERAAHARLSLAVALAIQGRTGPALSALDAAAGVLRGVDLARLEVQRAGVLRRLARHDDALASLRLALPALRRAGDELWQARAVGVRGMIRVEQGSWASAEADLGQAEVLFRRVEHWRDATAQVHNLAWCAACAGEVTTALARFEEAERQYSALGLTLAELPHDRTRLLLSAGLGREALELATAAAQRYAASDHGNGWSEAQLTCAEAALLVGDHAAARSFAAAARDAFARQRRSGWVALAQFVEARAAWESGDSSLEVFRTATHAARDLERLTLTPLAAASYLIAGRAASALGRRQAAHAAYAAVSRHRRGHAPAGLRAQAWLAEALVRVDQGRPVSARAALAAGLRAVDDYRATLGATELRVHAGGTGAELGALGMRLAADSGSASQLLAWAERCRAHALRHRPVRPPQDPILARDLGALRRVVAEIEAAATASRPTRSLYARQTELERAIRDRTRRLTGDGDGRSPTPSVRDLADALGDRALVELVDLDGRLIAVTVTGTRCRAHDLARVADAGREEESARFALRRLAHRHGSEASLDAARASALHAGRALDALLLEPLRASIGERALVVVPPARLHALPWGLLPSCRSRPVVVAPSAACWLEAQASPGPAVRKVALIGGPGLPGVQAELGQIASFYPSAIQLHGGDATAEAVLGALDGADLAHVAAHFAFRADNPLFSALRLADGPLTVVDLEGVRRAPHRIVLSACDSGLATVHPGDELMGLVATLLPMGTSSVVASVIPVPDREIRPLMVGLHRGIARGDAVAAALTDANAGESSEDPATFAASAAFVCLGSG